MKIGLGLPNSDKSLRDASLLVEIARRAEELGFSTLGTIFFMTAPSVEQAERLAAAVL